MRKIITAPDSFKGTLSSVQVCQFIQAAAQEAFPACEVLSVPIADGGEGSVDCMLAAGRREAVLLYGDRPFVLAGPRHITGV